jgi:hypothetical protein
MAMRQTQPGVLRRRLSCSVSRGTRSRETAAVRGSGGRSLD